MLENLVCGFQNIFTTKILKIFWYLTDFQNFQHFECFLNREVSPKYLFVGKMAIMISSRTEDFGIFENLQGRHVNIIRTLISYF